MRLRTPRLPSRSATPAQTPADPTADAAAEELRRVFGQGLSAEAAAALERASDANVPWEVRTRAVADGLARHYGLPSAPPPVPVAPAPSRLAAWKHVLLALLAYVALRPLMGLGHELTVLALAWLAHAAVGTGWWQPLIGLLGLDPIYAGAALRAVGGVQVAGLAIAGPLGAWLHALAPWAILGPEHVAPNAGISMVAAPGAPVLGRGVAAFGADVVWLAVGLGLAWGWARRGLVITQLGLLIQAQIVVHHLLNAQVSVPDLEASGLPFALALAVPSGGGWFSAGLGQLPETVRTALVGGSLVLLGYGCALLVLAAGAGLRRIVRRRRIHRHGAPTVRQARLVWTGAAVALVTAVSPIGALAVGNSNWEGGTTPLVAGRALVLSAAGQVRDLLPAPTPVGPIPVRIEQAPGGGWQYLVGGEPQVIRGVGYNPQYAGLEPGERARLYQRDFRAMRRLGINTIEGWFENQFDQVTLDHAARHGIGVLMPFELNQDWDYTDPAVQAGILDRVSAYVERYKSHPAVRMWAPGNENLHRILYPRWISKENDPAARARADAFAAFLPVLVDRIHALDADHPVIYRDAEDVYLPRLKAAFEATGVQRPWLVYGANVYSPARLQQVIEQWPKQWLGGPLVLSEFAPGGVGQNDRPLGYQQGWAIIRSRPDIVLGGLAYTWATNGPEELDRVFGLVDAQGIPSDGALAALAASYLADLEQTAGAGRPPN
jgi:hypothetical protein